MNLLKIRSKFVLNAGRKVRNKQFTYKGWSTRNVLSSVLHDKVRLTAKSDAKQTATLLMLSLSLSKNTMDEALLITII
jgi:hypothetical protein